METPQERLKPTKTNIKKAFVRWPEDAELSLDDAAEIAKDILTRKARRHSVKVFSEEFKQAQAKRWKITSRPGRSFDKYIYEPMAQTEIKAKAAARTKHCYVVDSSEGSITSVETGVVMYFGVISHYQYCLQFGAEDPASVPVYL